MITGGNSGIGAETAKDLANRGARVIMLCRNMQKAKETIHWIKSTNVNAKVEVVEVNLASLQSVRVCVSEVKRLTSRVDYLINNAGMFKNFFSHCEGQTFEARKLF